MMNPILRKLGERTGIPTAFWPVMACFLFSLFFLLFQGGKLASMLFIIVTLLGAYLLLGNWSGIKKIQGTRMLGNVGRELKLDAGQSLQVQILLQIPGFWPILYVLVKDRLIRHNGEEERFEGSLVPDWKRRGELEYCTPPLSRGLYRFGTMECATEDIFGLFEHKGRLELPNTLTVLPQTVAIKEWSQFHQMMRGTQYHSITTRAHRETTQINGVREYIYGDRVSRIHWNATAKTGAWKSKEYERESLPKTIVLLDRNQRSYKDKDGFELAVSVAASLFRFGALKGLSLGLLSVGAAATYFEPKQSHHHHNVIMNHLASVEADGFQPLQQVWRDRPQFWTPGSFFVIISPLKGTSMVQTLSWIDHHQMNSCHMWIHSQSNILFDEKESGAAADHWVKELQAKGFMGYDIENLADLPLILGGGKRYA